MRAPAIEYSHALLSKLLVNLQAVIFIFLLIRYKKGGILKPPRYDHLRRHRIKILVTLI